MTRKRRTESKEYDMGVVNKESSYVNMGTTVTYVLTKINSRENSGKSLIYIY